MGIGKHNQVVQQTNKKTQSSTKLTQGTFRVVIKDDLSLYKWGVSVCGVGG